MNNAHTLNFAGMYTVSTMYTKTYHVSFNCVFLHSFLILVLILLKVNDTITGANYYCQHVSHGSICIKSSLFFSGSASDEPTCLPG